MSIADITGFSCTLVPSMSLSCGQSHQRIVSAALAAADRYFEVLDTVPEIKDAPDAVHISQVEGRIEFENVSFQYGEDIPVLKNINLVIEPGQMVALVGPTGVGKTTMANLIPASTTRRRGGC